MFSHSKFRLIMIGTVLSLTLFSRAHAEWWWSGEQVAEGQYPSMAIDHQGNLGVSYWFNNTLYYAAKGTGPWQFKVVSTASVVYWYMQPSLTFDASGNPHIAYHTENDDLAYARMVQSSWFIETIDTNLSSLTPLTLDSSGNPCIAYQTYGAGSGLKYATLDGGLWAIEDLGLGWLGAPTLAVAYDDTPYIACRRSDGLWCVKKSTSGWSTELVKAGTIYGPAMAADPFGKLHVGFEVDGAGLHYAVKVSGVWTTEPVDSDNFGWRSIGTDSNGRAHIAYLDQPDAGAPIALKYATKNDTGWSIEMVDADLNLHPSLAVDPYDIPWVCTTGGFVQVYGRQVPDPANSEVTLMACPGGDAISEVMARDAQGRPLCNVPVTLAIPALYQCEFGFSPLWVESTTGEGGLATYELHLGGALPGWVGVYVGSTLGGPAIFLEEDAPMAGFDFDGDGYLDYDDNSAFVAMSGSSDPRGDYNRDGVVNLYDLAVYTSHLGHSCASTAVPEVGPGDFVLRLGPPNPNPFHTRTSLTYNVPVRGWVRIRIHDVQGRVVAIIVDEEQAAGEHHATWRGMDHRAQPLPTGVYFAEVELAGWRSVRKVILIR